MGFGILCMLGVVALWSFVPVLVKLLLGRILLLLIILVWGIRL